MAKADIDTASAAIGWYGKLPSTGDFLSRRLSHAFISTWDSWLQAGMVAVRDADPAGWQSAYSRAPIWSALLPCGVPEADPCIAVIAPSCDRVGRRFPFSVIVSLPSGPSPLQAFDSLPDFCAGIARTLSESVHHTIGIHEMDQRLLEWASQARADSSADGAGSSEIAEVLGDAAVDFEARTVPMSGNAAFPWPDLRTSFNPRAATSYWWNRPSADRPVCGFVHAGSLDTHLFSILFAGDERRRNASSTGA